ncbi:MAG: 30S ribosomal protein S5 [Spirochaetes bacterium GWF1_31_7]|nr:MAG: 30S ribosomal protein S5 [Spirochaetes bacterium GWE1_32_154]OHD47305.1 MAG: 30S ribosomal protein S5 [Spirochaetes bacterium GWE2_31_10]OHD47364.1 MAG: 30S ribosomal protein S5 [Spirochaetes bacterium GWF1_31_7]OHD81752.1 MAG: 30S ribosomal protein S5 [Spirochaetes bacterium RIFOXYB1_FULL_32_8]HBD92817.1 30S ribosomal protein S5 [Spirochaetia bacterium]
MDKLKLNDVFDDSETKYKESIVNLSRVAKVVKGGRRFSFSALVAVGDGGGNIGLGFGKANEVSDAISKASSDAKKNMKSIKLTKNSTLPHEIIGKYKSSHVIMKPAVPGTGVIAGGAVRAIMDAVGVHNVLAKVVGSKNKINVSKATLDGLSKLSTVKDVAKRRNKSMQEIF